MNLPQNAKHIFFTTEGYDDFRQTGPLKPGTFQLMPMWSSEYAAKKKEAKLFAKLPDDREMMRIILEMHVK